MKNTFGNSLTVTVFGESHGKAIGAVLDGIAPGITVDDEYIKKVLSMRRPSGAESTSRKEADDIKILSGVFNGKTTGTPVCIVIENKDTRSSDYSLTKNLARPSHADFTAQCKYHGYQDYRGGGHFSGRITAAVCAVGAIVMKALEDKSVFIGTHVLNCAGVFDDEFKNYKEDINYLSTASFPTLNKNSGEMMKEKIIEAKNNGDSVGAMLQTAIIGVPAGVGEPFFDSLESVISHAVFSVPGIKGIEFGKGFDFCSSTGAEVNDCFAIENSAVKTLTNNSGGINGGISNGMPIVFNTAVRPTPTISKPQNTVDMEKKENALIKAVGRHDPCIAHRARVVVDCVTALAVADMLTTRYGTDWLGEK